MVSQCSTSKVPQISTEQQNTLHSPTVVYIGTIEDKDADELLKSVDVVETVEEIESGPNSLTLSYYEPATSEKLNCPQECPEVMTRNPDNYRYLLKVVDKPLTSPALLLQWRVRPPDDDLCEENNSSPITPSSSMFSSAYTVTELGSDSNSDWSPPSEYSHSSRRVSETDDVTNREDVHDVRFQEYLQLFRQLTSVNQALLLGGLEAVSRNESEETQSICNGLHRQGSTHSIICNYISSRDEKEKEEEELWVANDATYYFSHGHHDEVCDQLKISCVPEVNLIINQEVSDFTIPESQNTSCQMNTSRLDLVSTASASTQTIYSCLLPPLNYYSVPKRSDRSRNLSSGVDAPSLSVSNNTSSSAVGAEDEQMAALICPLASTERRHFSARQRPVENDVKKTESISNEITLGNVGSSNFSNAVKENFQKSSSPITSSTTQQPTKRFSFLIRSSSMDHQDIVKLNTPISASDKAILARLEELKVNQVKEAPPGKKASSSLHPPCRRCGEPVYPQERLQSSKDMLFHTSCFKCSQCGVRLNLKTFFRNPLTLKDYRIFCKSHVPTLDPGKVAVEKKVHAEASKEKTPALCRVSSVATTSHPRSDSVDRVVVKGDTQGLRYF
ncbi:Zinc finger LIM-type [Trinorchestia longiramus]|nr:Zinc finger LIM-type [Trinorchestia longiramus]